MLKDITLGQYFPGNSLIHRLDPRTKLLILIAYIVVLFMAPSWVSFAVVFSFFIKIVILYTILSIRLTKIKRGKT